MAQRQRYLLLEGGMDKKLQHETKNPWACKLTENASKNLHQRDLANWNIQEGDQGPQSFPTKNTNLTPNELGQELLETINSSHLAKENLRHKTTNLLWNLPLPKNGEDWEVLRWGRSHRQKKSIERTRAPTPKATSIWIKWHHHYQLNPEGL